MSLLRNLGPPAHEGAVAFAPPSPSSVGLRIDLRAPVARLDPQMRDEHDRKAVGVRHLDRAPDVHAVVREGTLEGGVDAATRKIKDATKRRQRDPTRANFAALFERPTIRLAAVTDVRVIAVLDRADRDA